ncbi:MAG: hypothetical protein RLZZ535_2368, partial [Cyanobacteriota bacterium]
RVDFVVSIKTRSSDLESRQALVDRNKEPAQITSIIRP